MRCSSDFMVAVPPPTSRRLWARSSGMSPDQTPEATMELGKRAPSSLLGLSVSCRHGRTVHSDGEVIVWGNLLGPVHYTDGKFGFNPVLSENFEHLNASRDTEDAIVATACWLRVEMRPCKGGGAFAEAWTDGEYISHSIDRYFASERFGCCDKPVACFFVGIGEGKTGHACLGRGAMGALVGCFMLLTTLGGLDT